MREALRTAIDHLEHMAAWLGKLNSGYSFESLGEDMPGLKAALAEPAAVPAAISDAERDVLAERRRHVEEEGWTPEHDDEHDKFELAKAASAYLSHACNNDRTRADNARKPWAPSIWPWHRDWWKPKDRRRDLVRAAALIIAEIERLDRAAAKAEAAR